MVEPVRWLSERDLSAHWGFLRGERTGPPVQVDAPPVPVPRGPKATMEHLLETVIRPAMGDRVKFEQLVRMLRSVHGARVAHLSDTEIMRLAVETYRAEAIAATTRTFARLGRGRELVVQAGGVR